MECAICGKEVEKLFRIEIEGSVVEVCESCVKFGRKIEEVKDIHPKKKVTPGVFIPKREVVMVENYGKLIEDSRKKMGLTRKEFARKMNEKESVIRRVEMEELVPDEKLLKKIEKFLEIKLTEVYEEQSLQVKSKKGTLTIGDVVEFE